MKTEFLYGFHAILEALKANRRTFYEILIIKKKVSKRINRVESIAKSKNIKINKLNVFSPELVRHDLSNQGILARVCPYPYTSLSELIVKRKNNSKNNFLIILDNIVDPHNLGAIARTAICAGVDGVIITKDNSASATPTVSAISTGAIEHIFLAQITNMINTIKTLKQHGVWIIGLDKNSKQDIYSVDLTMPIALIIGGEEKGLRPLVKKHCDFIAQIPQVATFNSLNASVAGAITMYETYRQRKNDFKK